MHKLPEEAPLLVDNFGTLFLIHISDPFQTSVDFIHFLDYIYLLSIGAHLLSHFVRSLFRLALPSLRCGRFAAHLLTHFVRSLIRLVLPSLRCSRFTAHLLTHFVRSLHSLWRSLRSRSRAHFISCLVLTNAHAESSLTSLYNKRSLRSHLLYS